MACPYSVFDIDLAADDTLYVGTSGNQPCPITCRGVLERHPTTGDISLLTDGDHFYDSWDMELRLNNDLLALHLGVGGSITLPPSIALLGARLNPPS